MARPRRPIAERDLVRRAAGDIGSAKMRAQRLASRVARETMAAVDRDPGERIFDLLRTYDDDPARALATSPDIDTAALVRAARLARLEARGFRRLLPAEAANEDEAVCAEVGQRLAERYRRHLSGNRK
ncbi:hypothetical protein GCM10011329_04090 [Stakelama pacifica]|nr:hypothetical protein GCM10011329_04090 [Stakelama pacifica]